MSTDSLLREAAALHQAGHLAAADARYRAVLAQSPDHAVALHNLGVVAAQSGDLQNALALFERALGAGPDQVDCWRSVANCRYLLGYWEEAESTIEQAGARGLRDAGIDAIGRAMRGRPGGRKVFCIGRNKTGTTSIEAAFRSLGLTLGLQARGEMLTRDWARRDFTRIIELVRTADAFQDVPFSQSFTFQAVDMHFPGSKFILTVRNSPEEWFESLKRFQTRIVNKGRLPTAADLREFNYRYKGFLWEGFVNNFGEDESLLYDKDAYIAHYEDHNRSVIRYFRRRPDDLLVLNVSEPDAMRRLCEFLGYPYRGQPMPHLNRSA